MGVQSWRERLDKALDEVVQQVVQALDPERIIVFGSMARGDVHEDSDLDLLIVKETDQPFLQRIDDVLMVLDTDVPVEPLVYTPAELERLRAEGRDFILTILEEGRVVYERRSKPPTGPSVARNC